jgi:Tfp pilus assembly protein PilE
MKKGRRVFTIIIAGIIAGILAAIAVPLYTGHVERARATEATSIMGAIITSQKVAKSRTGKCYKASTVAEFKSRGIDITDTKFFTYKTAPVRLGMYDTFTVIVTTTDAFAPAGRSMTYTKYPTAKPPHPMLHIEPY